MRLSTEWRFYFRGRKCPKMCLTIHWSVIIRDGPLENLWGRGGAGEVTRQLILKKIHARNLVTKKIPAARKFPSPAA